MKVNKFDLTFALTTAALSSHSPSATFSCADSAHLPCACRRASNVILLSLPDKMSHIQFFNEQRRLGEAVGAERGLNKVEVKNQLDGKRSYSEWNI